jgi:shikimate 5-dehydrogenase
LACDGVEAEDACFLEPRGHTVGLLGVGGLAEGLAAHLLARHRRELVVAQPADDAAGVAVAVGAAGALEHRAGVRPEIALPQLDRAEQRVVADDRRSR